MKIRFKNVLFELCISMPVLYAILCCIKTSIANKVVFFELIIAGIVIFNIYTKKRTIRKKIFFILLLFIFIFYNCIVDSVAAIIHINFYSYLLLFIMFEIFIQKDERKEFYEYFFARKKRIMIYFIFFCAILLYSCIYMNGIRYEYNSSIPILYGPFEIPHMLAYILIIFYCMFSLLKNLISKKISLLIKFLCITLIVFTAVRTATVAIGILILFDFISVNKINKKILYVIITVVLLAYLFINTNLLVNNPIINKTLEASKSGSITNGREIYREITMSYYINDATIIEKIFGTGMSKLIDIIYKSIGVKIHAHNDYVNLLVGYGIIGFLLIFYLHIKIWTEYKNKYAKVLLEIFIFVLCFYNGLAMYIMFTASLPIILCYFGLNINNVVIEKENVGE